jgi:hypothetical protein
MAVNAGPGQDHVEALAGAQLMHAVQRLQRPVAANMQAQVVPAPRLHGHAAGGALRERPSPGVKLDPQPDRAVQDERGADQLLASGRRIVAQIGAGSQRQRVGHCDHAGSAAHLGDQDGGIRLVALTRLDDLVRRDREPPASGIIEHAAEQRLGVEARQAQPRDAPVEADQRRGRPVADQAHVLEREIAVAPAHRAKGRVLVDHRRSSAFGSPGTAGSYTILAESCPAACEPRARPRRGRW